jgi:hypothetical protein
VFSKSRKFLHSQKLRTVVGQKYHPEWYFLTRPTQTIRKGSYAHSPKLKNRV